MSWSIRHQDSPRLVESLTQDQIVAGLEDGEWDPTDEVLGPGESRWTPLESHPRFADVAAEIEEATQTPLTLDPEEQRIDMNPLIDVCLVLLVFFIMATALGLLDRVLPMPTGALAERALPEVPIETVRERMIIVQLRRDRERATYTIDNQDVPAADLQPMLARQMHLTGRQEVVIDAKDVQWGDVVRIIDADQGASVRKVHFKANRPESRP